jgi:hypothetical protein
VRDVIACRDSAGPGRPRCARVRALAPAQPGYPVEVSAGLRRRASAVAERATARGAGASAPRSAL